MSGRHEFGTLSINTIDSMHVQGWLRPAKQLSGHSLGKKAEHLCERQCSDLSASSSHHMHICTDEGSSIARFFLCGILSYKV